MHMINYLCRSKIVAPTARGGRGRGRARAFSYGDLVLLRLLAKLLAQGISVMRLRKALSTLQEEGRHNTDLVLRKRVVTDGYDLYLSDEDGWRGARSRQYVFAFFIELGPIRKEVVERAKPLRLVA